MPDFVVLSNNCWGAEVYKELKLPYNTPFIGLFIPPESYIKLLKDLKSFLAMPLVFIEQSNFEIYNDFRRKNKLDYPIGVLGKDIEVHFQHYNSVEKAEEKWKTRTSRINFDQDTFFVKFCDREVNHEYILQEFELLPFKNKVYFTVNNLPGYKPSVYIEEEKHLLQVIDGKSLYKVSKRYFDTIKWIKTGDGSLNRLKRISLQLHLMKISFKTTLKKLWRFQS